MTGIVAVVVQLHLSFCNPIDCSMPGFPVLHHLPEFAQTHVHWVNDAIQQSHPLLSTSPSVFNLFQHQDLFQWISSSNVGASALASVLPVNIQGWFPFELTSLISLQTKGLSRVFSNITIHKHQFFITQPSLWSNSHIHTWLLELFNLVAFKIFVHTEKSTFLHVPQMHTYIHLCAHLKYLNFVENLQIF